MAKATKRTGEGGGGELPRSRYLPFALIAGVGALAHLWCLGSVFFLDDVLIIRDNTELREGAWWKPRFQQWTYFWYWVQTKVWGMSPVGFHAVNWLLHTTGHRFFSKCQASRGAHPRITKATIMAA